MPPARNHGTPAACAAAAGAAPAAAAPLPDTDALTAATTPSSPLTDEQHRKLNLWLNASGAGPPLERTATVADLVAHEAVDIQLLCALDVAPPALLHAKASLADMVALGYTAQALADSPALTASFVKTFGKAPCAVAMLRDASAAQVLAGTFAAQQLGLTPRTLLSACGNCRDSAIRVVDRLIGANEGEAPLAGCCDVLARSGIDARFLVSTWGIPPTRLATVLATSPQELAVLGCFVDDRLPATPATPASALSR